MIEEYSFGSIKILGRIYEEDVELNWKGEVLKWWRKESHLIDVEDVKRAVEANPDVIIIGTGFSGIAKVTKEAQNFITESGIKLIIDDTKKAVKSFNIILEKSREEKEVKVIGLFHLTC